MENTLLSQFKSRFLNPWSFNKWKAQFLALSPLQQKAVIELMQDTVPARIAFEQIELTESDDLLLHYDKTIAEITHQWVSESAW